VERRLASARLRQAAPLQRLGVTRLVFLAVRMVPLKTTPSMT
jgi:hypothetical protein